MDAAVTGETLDGMLRKLSAPGAVAAEAENRTVVRDQELERLQHELAEM